MLAMIAYLAADRFLIKHVEIANVNDYSAAATLTTSAQTEILADNTVQEETLSENNEETTVVEKEAAAESDPAVETITYDEWNYQSADISITIEKHTSGSGSNTLNLVCSRHHPLECHSIGKCLCK